jgi:hypothetical protein
MGVMLNNDDYDLKYFALNISPLPKPKTVPSPAVSGTDLLGLTTITRK